MMPAGQQTFSFAMSESRLGHVVNLISSHQNSLADRRRKPDDDQRLIRSVLQRG